MARVLVTRRIDDLDGGDATQTVLFALAGVDYVLDLSDEHAEALRALLRRYAAAGRYICGHRINLDKRRPRVDRVRSQRIRIWARRNGIPLVGDGRIPVRIIALYERQNGQRDT
ncbi:MAG: nucleoid-associated protein Lsr2 [Amycolatopsis sp.]|uniref:histone-like nucleoid-structuring protein Lsr2 n=1 Tax=Amycolatopsis sp. TaxID=37632 RepID=UPI00260B96D1|nr:Lsr2 family protein [Amycolatopsis sp.]MCU1685933.1 nucleoid-associated protein Lsr2 [Amycolatopsis sp.]